VRQCRNQRNIPPTAGRPSSYSQEMQPQLATLMQNTGAHPPTSSRGDFLTVESPQPSQSSSQYESFDKMLEEETTTTNGWILTNCDFECYGGSSSRDTFVQDFLLQSPNPTSSFSVLPPAYAIDSQDAGSSHDLICDACQRSDKHVRSLCHVAVTCCDALYTPTRAYCTWGRRSHYMHASNPFVFCENIIVWRMQLMYTNRMKYYEQALFILFLSDRLE
jgi:hypothetical protein